MLDVNLLLPYLRSKLQTLGQKQNCSKPETLVGSYSDGNNDVGNCSIGSNDNGNYCNGSNDVGIYCNGSKKIKSSMARSLSVEDLLPQNVSLIINSYYLQ